jgi:hypothetical protein
MSCWTTSRRGRDGGMVQRIMDRLTAQFWITPFAQRARAGPADGNNAD